MSRNRFNRGMARPARHTSWAETILDSRPFTEADATSIVNKVRVALQLLLEGKADELAFIRLGCAVNVASIRAEQIDPALVEILGTAGAALTEGQRIHDTHGRYGLTGPGRHQLAAGIDAYEAILRASSPKQMQLAEQEVIRRLTVKRPREPA